MSYIEFCIIWKKYWRMSLFKYRLLYRENAVYELDNYLKLTREQKEIIYRDEYWLPFVLLKDIKDKKVPPFWTRLTYPLLLLTLLVMFIFMPINYIITGQFSYNEHKTPFKWVFSWGRKLHYYWYDMSDENRTISFPKIIWSLYDFLTNF